jgi:hypothetical protein
VKLLVDMEVVVMVVVVLVVVVAPGEKVHGARVS